MLVKSVQSDGIYCEFTVISTYSKYSLAIWLSGISTMQLVLVITKHALV